MFDPTLGIKLAKRLKRSELLQKPKDSGAIERKESHALFQRQWNVPSTREVLFGHFSPSYIIIPLFFLPIPL